MRELDCAGERLRDGLSVRIEHAEKLLKQKQQLRRWTARELDLQNKKKGNPLVETPQLEAQASQLETQVPQPEVQAPQLEAQVPQPEVQAPQPEVQAPQLEAQAPQLEVQAPQPEAQVQQVEVRC
jgi:hypothetical protein